MLRIGFFLIGMMGAVAGVAEAWAQPAADTTLRQVAALARFEEARALAADPAGRLYVADAGADVVVRLGPDGQPMDRLGGPGVEPGTFDGPVDVDPTNGLVLVVADVGNGRLQRFTRDFGLLDVRPVGRAAEDGWSAARSEGEQTGTGRPIAVATAATDVSFAVEVSEGVVLKWEGGGAARVIGGFGAGDGRLREPVALAVGPEDLLFVADRGRAAVLVYDLAGTFVRLVAEGVAAEARALFVHDGALWIVLPDRLLAYDLEGRLWRTVAVPLEAPLVDAAFSGGTLYLLTSTRLYRAGG